MAYSEKGSILINTKYSFLVFLTFLWYIVVSFVIIAFMLLSITLIYEWIGSIGLILGILAGIGYIIGVILGIMLLSFAYRQVKILFDGSRKK